MFPSAKAELGRQWNTQNPSQPILGFIADESPFPYLYSNILGPYLVQPDDTGITQPRTNLNWELCVCMNYNFRVFHILSGSQRQYRHCDRPRLHPALPALRRLLHQPRVGTVLAGVDRAHQLVQVLQRDPLREPVGGLRHPVCGWSGPLQCGLSGYLHL